MRPAHGLRVAALRRPGLVVPGWFPLVVERLHHRLNLPAVIDERIEGSLMQLDLRDYTQRKIFYRSYEPAETRFVRRLLRQGDLVLDAGANVGFFTLLAARAVGPAGSVIAFEPVPANADALEVNLALNGYSQVRVVRAALGATSRQTQLGLDAPGTGTSGWYVRGGTHTATTVAQVRLDDVVQSPRRARLLKADVEGMEPDVLAGAKRLLADAPPDRLLLEVNGQALARQGHTFRDLTKPLLEAGYRLAQLGVAGKLKWLEPSELVHVSSASAAPFDGGLLAQLRHGVSARRGFFTLVGFHRDER